MRKLLGEFKLHFKISYIFHIKGYYVMCYVYLDQTVENIGGNYCFFSSSPEYLKEYLGVVYQTCLKEVDLHVG